MSVLTHVMAFMIGGTVGITALAILMAGKDDEAEAIAVKPPCDGGYCPLCGAYDEWESYKHGVPVTEENMAKFGWVRERTCERILYKLTGVLVCSECGAGMPKQLDKYCYLHYCPNCGAKVTPKHSEILRSEVGE